MIPPELASVVSHRLDNLEGRVKIEYFHQNDGQLAVPGRRPCPSCDPTKKILEQLAGFQDEIELRVHDFHTDTKAVEKWGIERVPGIVIHGEVNRPIRFYGIPAGALLPILVDVINAAAGKPPTPPPEVTGVLKKLRDPVQIRVLGLLRHPPSGQAAATAFGVALLSDKISAAFYVLEDNPDLIQQLELTRVPLTLVNDKRGFAGVTTTPALMQFCLDMQAHPDEATGPEVLPGSVAELKPPAAAEPPPRPPSSGLVLPGQPQGDPAQRPPGQGGGPPPRRTPGGIILPGR